MPNDDDDDDVVVIVVVRGTRERTIGTEGLGMCVCRT